MGKPRHFKNSVGRPWIDFNGAASVEVGKSSWVKAIAAGGITGGIEILITYPIEYVKTQLQLDEKRLKTGGLNKYSGMFDCAQQTVKSHGFLGLYRGLSVLLIGSIPKSAVRFGAFEILKSSVSDERGSLSAHMRLLCGLGAGIFEAILVVTPMETVKVKFINDQTSPKPQYRGFFHGVSHIIKEQGFRGVYQGVITTTIKQGSNQAVRFFVVETCKEKYRKGDRNVYVPKLVVGVFGAIGGAASVFANMPVDVVKTRMQSLESTKYSGTWDCFVQIWKQEGPFAFYSGTVPRLSRNCLDVAITFMIFDSFMDLFNKV